MNKDHFFGIDEFENIIWVTEKEHYQFFLTKWLAEQVIFTFSLDAKVLKNRDNAVWYIKMCPPPVK